MTTTSLALPSKLDPAHRAAINAAWATATQRNFKIGWARWVRWCAAQKLEPFPVSPETLIDYVRSQHEQIPSVLNALKSINQVYKLASEPSPTKNPFVMLAVRGMRKTYGKPEVGRAALTLPLLKQVIREIDRSTPVGTRDAALLLVGWWGALRRKTISDMRYEQVHETPDGYRVELGRHKTDVLGARRDIVHLVHRHEVPAVCAPCALQEWLAVRPHIATLFAAGSGNYVVARPVSGNAIWAMVRRRCGLAGLDATQFGAHSLRAGLITTAISQGESASKIQQVTKHANEAMLMRYYRESEAGPNYLGRTLKVT